MLEGPVGNRTTEELVICIVIGVAMLTLLLPDLYAVGWVALWEGAVAKDSRTAANNAQVKVLCLPWLVLLAFVPLAGIFRGFVNPWFAIGVLVSGSALADGLLARRARQKLRTELPERARRRASGEVEYYGGWIRFGRWLGQRWRSAVGVM